MLEKIEFFDGALRGSKLFLLINLLLVIHFVWFWYRNYRKWGWKMDFWTLVTARYFVVHVLFMYPFNGSFENTISFNLKEFQKIDVFLDKAYLVTITGYLCFYIGRGLFTLVGKSRVLGSIFSPIEKMIEVNIKNPISANLILFLGLFFLGITIYFQVVTDNLFSPRTFFQSNGMLRPLYNLCLVFYPITLLVIGLRLLNKPKLRRIILFLFLIIFSAFLGTRMAILEPMLLLFSFYCIKYNYKIKVKRIIFIGIVFIYSTMIVLSFRSDEVQGLFDSGTSKAILYGNTFSDTRDFAYVMSYWDFEHLKGRTYVAGIISFIPREFSKIREKWSLGIFTATITDYNSKTFPGFRPGYFGEAFFNFGFLGVIILGIISGYVLRYVDLRIKQSELLYSDIIKAYSKIVPWLFVLCLSISIGFASLYVLIVINFFLFIFRKFISFLNFKRYSE
jgi:oligosaccharide repeat unit polymerase